MLGEDVRTSGSISSIRVGRLGCLKLIPGAGIRLCLRSGDMCLCMRIGTGQFGDVWMFEWVVPCDFLAGQIDFIAVVTNLSSRKVNKFPNIQDYISLENYLPFEFSQR